MLNQDDQDAQRVSLLTDGELPVPELDRVMAYLTQSVQAQQTWDSYHLVGEVLRSGAASARPHDPAFVQKLQHKLAHENIKFVAVSAEPIKATGQNSIKNQSANEGWWQRVAGLASVALVSVLAWQGYALLAGHTAGTAVQLAETAGAGTPSVGAAQPVMLRDPRLDALLAAHRQFGGTSALQMPSGFLRNATFDEGQR